jgi:hypothetical protein
MVQVALRAGYRQRVQGRFYLLTGLVECGLVAIRCSSVKLDQVASRTDRDRQSALSSDNAPTTLALW